MGGFGAYDIALHHPRQLLRRRRPLAGALVRGRRNRAGRLRRRRRLRAQRRRRHGPGRPRRLRRRRGSGTTTGRRPVPRLRRRLRRRARRPAAPRQRPLRPGGHEDRTSNAHWPTIASSAPRHASGRGGNLELSRSSGPTRSGPALRRAAPSRGSRGHIAAPAAAAAARHPHLSPVGVRPAAGRRPARRTASRVGSSSRSTRPGRDLATPASIRGRSRQRDQAVDVLAQRRPRSPAPIPAEIVDSAPARLRAARPTQPRTPTGSDPVADPSRSNRRGSASDLRGRESTSS